METTPDTLNYMIAGYTVFSIVMIAYLVSLYGRWRRLERDRSVLDELAKPQS